MLHIVPRARVEIVDAKHFIAARQKLFAQMRPDEACAARYQDTSIAQSHLRVGSGLSTAREHRPRKSAALPIVNLNAPLPSKWLTGDRAGRLVDATIIYGAGVKGNIDGDMQ
jgi:hypothetical protein